MNTRARYFITGISLTGLLVIAGLLGLFLPVPASFAPVTDLVGSLALVTAPGCLILYLRKIK